MATPDQISKLFNVLCAAYPHYAKDRTCEELDFTLTVYQRMLADVDPALLDMAATHHTRSSKWFPSVAELIDSAHALMTIDDPNAEEAWLEVKRVLHRWHSDIDPLPKFSSTIIDRSVEAIGLRALALMDMDDESAHRAHFMRIYAAFAQREKDRVVMLPETREAARALKARAMLNGLTLKLSDGSK